MSTVSSSDSQQASHLFPHVEVSLLVVRSIVVRRTLSARCVSFFRVDPLRLIMPSAAEKSQHGICCAASVCISSMPPNCRSQFHCCRRPMPSQAQESAATNSASPLLSAIVDCFPLDAMIGNQPSLPLSHDAVPLVLNRSASPAQSESPSSTLSPQELSSQLPGWCRRPHSHDSRFSTEVSQN